MKQWIKITWSTYVFHPIGIQAVSFKAVWLLVNFWCLRITNFFEIFFCVPGAFAVELNEPLPGGVDLVSFVAAKCDELFCSQHLPGITLRVETFCHTGAQLSFSDLISASPDFVDSLPDLCCGQWFLFEDGVARCWQGKCLVGITLQHIVHCLPGILLHLQQNTIT